MTCIQKRWILKTYGDEDEVTVEPHPTVPGAYLLCVDTNGRGRVATITIPPGAARQLGKLLIEG